ncbi:MAG: SoxR reducing system RseC family protein [Holophagae bacterium]|nr:SoxR reducing system RseC family protein [Holophagae bacterium]
MLGTIITITPDDAFIIKMDADDGNATCGSCSFKGHCSLPARKTLTLVRPGQWAVGQRVEVDISPRIIVMLSASVYLLPVILMVACAGIMAGKGDSWAVAGAFAGLITGIVVNLALNRFLPFEKIIQVKRC